MKASQMPVRKVVLAKNENWYKIVDEFEGRLVIEVSQEIVGEGACSHYVVYEKEFKKWDKRMIPPLPLLQAGMFSKHMNLRFPEVPSVSIT